MCSNPLKGFPDGKTKTGKTNYIICSSDVHHIEITNSGAIIKADNSFVSNQANKVIFENIEIPCGQCLECRLEYSRQWANRCMLEAKDHKDNCFITLTYDDLHLPLADSVNSLTGECTKVKTLVKRDLQLFLKRLRKYVEPEKIRFFACGEYGDISVRPHYHLIIFGWDPRNLLNDCSLISKADGINYYSSEILTKLWTYGNNLVGSADWNSMAYVARYVVKKADKFTNNDFYKSNNIAPEFITMSRRPGIGANWYDRNKKCYAIFLDNFISTDTGSKPIGHPRYFDKLLEQDYPDLLEARKETSRKLGIERKKLVGLQTSLPYKEARRMASRAKERKLSILKERNGI